ncbi:hypothetical protein ABMY26_00165 (plasmid) [Azospirillum sp. HJ39]|uniref:hypothetical protein n=1 Tax=Azospirillum sp. HJ39 TaxID=3159496 RepID=UPI0035564600
MADEYPGQPERLSPEGAKFLAEQIEGYWRDCGFRSVKTHIERVCHGVHALYCVRSNLIGGLPPRY